MGLQGQVPSVRPQGLPAQDKSFQPATEDGSAAPVAQAAARVGITTEGSQLFFPRRLNKTWK